MFILQAGLVRCVFDHLLGGYRTSSSDEVLMGLLEQMFCERRTVEERLNAFHPRSRQFGVVYAEQPVNNFDNVGLFKELVLINFSNIRSGSLFHQAHEKTPLKGASVLPSLRQAVLSPFGN